MPNLSKYNLGFISDDDIFEHVRNTIKSYRTFINLEGFNANIIDPIKLTFDARIYKKSMVEIVDDECIRQIDKSNTNVIGYFHQNIFKYAGGGWEVPASGYDLINREKHIFAEIKNKHNTMNSASSQKTYITMQHTLLEDDQAVCYLVEVISRHSGDANWCISLDGKKVSHKKIRKISMDKFYELVFGDKLAFYKLCQALPDIIEDVMEEVGFGEINNTVQKELAQLDTDIQKSLYLLAFETYEGFKE